MQPYYERGGLTIYHGDCREVLPALRATFLIADPPYNAGIQYGQHDDAMSDDAYCAWLRSWFPLARAAAKRIIVFPGHGNIMLWSDVARPSAVGCWDKIGSTPSKGTLGFCGWEPYFYWTGDQGMLGGTDVVRARTESRNFAHPCAKPVSLMEALIVKARAEETIDPFMGSGTTLVASKNLGRKAIGIEIEERYCEIAVQRLRQEAFVFDDIAMKDSAATA